jgi:cobalt-zinc-cadmium efflux system membrane fusion protein
MRSSARHGLLLLSVLACQRTPPASDTGKKEPSAAAAPSEAAEQASGHHEALPRRITVSEEVVKSAGIRVTAVTKAVLAEALSLPGEVAADPDRLARISSPAQGRIEEVRFREGAEVKKGDALVVVRVPEIAKARASHLATQAKAKAAQANAARLRALLDQRLAAEQEVLNAESEAEALELEARSTADQLGALGAAASGAFSITLRAPIDGSVVARNAVVGQPTVTDQVLGTVANLREVWFLARVFEKDLGALRVGAHADVHLNAYADQHFLGTVEYIGQQIDPVARTVTARVRLKNEQGLLRLGLFGTCQIATGGASKAEPRLLVADASVTEIGDKPVVFVREKAGEFQVHAVTRGREALGKVEILAGLREGEEVVSDGVFTLKSIVLKGSFAEEE